MQAQAYNFIPPKNFSQQIDLPSTFHKNKNLSLPILLPKNGNNINIIPRAISITAPTTTTTTHEIPIPTTLDDDDTITAFWDYQFLFMSQRSETTEPLSLRVVDGAIPTDFPSGTYYLTGPGMFTDDHGSTVHPLDGHGYLRSFDINGVDGKVKFMAKYIKTEAQVEECDPLTKQWKFTHRGPFSVLKNGKKIGNTKVMKNVANTSVLKWSERLLCLWEGGEPYEIDYTTLNTLGRFNIMHMNDQLLLDDNDHPQGLESGFWNMAAEILKPLLYGVFKMPPKRLLSHYKIDNCKNRLLMMSCNAEDMLLPRSNFTFYEFDSNFKMVQSKEFNIPDHLMIHDWAFTESHYILFGNRIKLDVPGSMTAVCGLSPMICALSVNPSKATSPIYLLPRNISENDESKRDWKIPIEAPSQQWVLHVGNAFEIKDEINSNTTQIHIQATGCSYHWFNFQKMFGYDWRSGKLDPSMMNVNDDGHQQKLLPHLIQVSIKLDNDGKCEKCSLDDLSEWSKASDFPVINQDYLGRRNKYMYAATSSGSRKALPSFPFDTVVKINHQDKSVSTWSAGRRRFIGEPIFIPKQGKIEEDDGYLLVVEYAVSTQRCYLVVLDARDIGTKNSLVARVEVPRSLNFPLGFHGFWAPN